MKKIIIPIIAFSLLLLALAISVSAVGEACSDGTVHGACGPTASKPKYCENGNLTDNCEKCGCPSTKQCNTATNACGAFSAGWVCKELTIRGLQKTDGSYQILENCPAGCYEGVCNPDPCVNITCKDACFSNTTLNTKGFCEGGICIYKKQKCGQGCTSERNVGFCEENRPKQLMIEALAVNETENETTTVPITTNATNVSEPETEEQEPGNETGQAQPSQPAPEKKGFFQKILGFFAKLKFW